MSLAEFKGIIDQVKGYVRIASLWNYGEPFLNKELLSMINYAASVGIYVITSTNGEFFESKEFCFKLVQSGLQHLIISLDGADQETNNKYRMGSDFSKIVNGFRSIWEAKQELKSKTPVVELQFMLMKHNEHQRSRMRELATQLHADIYCEKTIFIDYNDSEFQNIAKEFLPNNPNLRRYTLSQDGTFTLKGKIPNSCSCVYLSAVINSDGMVVPCCWDLYSAYAMGNVYEESLRDIWRNNKYRTFREQIERDRKSIPVCNICREGRQATKRQIILR
jgi:radical SAM protein with 4Fe4S-binding SPASM domain